MSLRLSNSIRFLHWKAFFPIWSNFGGNSTETRPESQNACSPMDCSLSGKVICTSFEHFKNAYSPMDCSLSGKFICTSFEHLKNAKSPMLIMLGLFTLVSSLHFANAP